MGEYEEVEMVSLQARQSKECETLCSRYRAFEKCTIFCTDIIFTFLTSLSFHFLMF
jgi:hypothetical protein